MIEKTEHTDSSSSASSPVAVFCDFDGTISLQDVGNRLFHHFSDGKSDDPVAKWLSDQIDSRQCLIEEAAVMREVTEADLHDFIDRFEIDRAFPAFVDFCRTRKWPLYILSDGLDVYIDRLLKRHGLAGLPVFSNRAVVENGRLRLDWPWIDNECDRCANCKGFQIRRLRTPGQTAVYIGDGKSDLCALPEADMILAKGFLADHCRQNGIDFVPFNDFAEITDILKDSPLTLR
ncbi:MAG: MtnX-like HAD-IB family phosphatase [candidate division Zixibacteria bacterium]|nr:MtnX-like HAD-IB family phosphatase [candidate division Zixibacteria bacterium]